ncbi:hypothetical protein BaRGS_00006731 [Batillaria attramentaria]|uniref:Uncharacterized protein n=1 Tax=Batillaria attramentaria TaxID=370345 RepID=A0ABD0LQL8_9CAEN
MKPGHQFRAGIYGPVDGFQQRRDRLHGHHASASQTEKRCGGHSDVQHPAELREVAKSTNFQGSPLAIRRRHWKRKQTPQRIHGRFNTDRPIG